MRGRALSDGRAEVAQASAGARQGVVAVMPPATMHFTPSRTSPGVFVVNRPLSPWAQRHSTAEASPPRSPVRAYPLGTLPTGG